MGFHRIQNAIELFGPRKPPVTPPPLSTRSDVDSPLGGNGTTRHSQEVRAPSAPVTAEAPSSNGDCKNLGTPPTLPVHIPGHTPQLDVPWGAFRQSFASSVFAQFGPRAAKDFLSMSAFRDSWVEGRLPQRAVLAAALWHILFVILPYPHLPAGRRNAAFENVELTWSGPIDDLPLLEIPPGEPKLPPREKVTEPLPAARPTPVPEAFDPGQRIFTDPVRPTHPRQTLINPAVRFEPPKILPNLPNVVQLQQLAVPARPKLRISEEALKQLRPRERRIATVTVAPLPDVPTMEPQIAELSIPSVQNGPARPKLELNAGAAPRIAKRAQSGDARTPELAATQLTAADGARIALIALSAAPAPPVPIAQPPQGNLAARVALSPEGKRALPDSSASGEARNSEANSPLRESAGKGSIAISISGGNPPPRISAPVPRALLTGPAPRVPVDDDTERIGPPDFAALPPTAEPEAIFASKKVYTLNVNIPNVNSATGSWIVKFSELHTSFDGPRIASADLSGPVPLKTVDPKYPPELISERVQGEVVLYAVIRQDGTVDSIQLVRGIDEQLNANAMSAFSRWKFRPATKAGAPVELEAIVHVPFRLAVP